MKFNIRRGGVIKHKFQATQSVVHTVPFFRPLSFVKKSTWGTTCYYKALISALHNPSHCEVGTEFCPSVLSMEQLFPSSLWLPAGPIMLSRHHSLRSFPLPLPFQYKASLFLLPHPAPRKEGPPAFDSPLFQNFSDLSLSRTMFN